MAINEWYREIVKYGLKTIELYARKHGYDFRLFQDEIYDGKRDFPWYKIKAVQSILSEYDIVFWIDADGFVSKPELSVEYFQNFLQDRDVLCAKDWNGVLNTGLMIIKNTPFCHQLLRETWDNKEEFDPSFHEQASMSQIYQTNRLDSQSKIMILPIEYQHLLFTYWASYYPGRAFFTHIARCAHDPTGFIYTLDCYCPIKMDEDVEGEFEDRIAWLNNERECRRDIESWIRNGPRSRESSRFRNFGTEKTKLKKNL
jgi:hypothetical protein